MASTDPNADAGPCTNGGAPVRDHALLDRFVRAGDYVRARLGRGEVKYGSVLRVGWDRAETELRQELADAVSYALALGEVDLAAHLAYLLELRLGPTAEPPPPFSEERA